MEPTSAPARPLWDRIQTLCASRGWSGVRLERETGVSRQTVNKWRTQPRPPQAATVNAVATVLGIPLEDALRLAGILPGEEQPPSEEPAPEREPQGLTRDELIDRADALMAEAQEYLRRARETG